MRNTVSNTMGSIGFTMILFAFAAAFHYDDPVMGAGLFVAGFLLVFFTPNS